MSKRITDLKVVKKYICSNVSVTLAENIYYLALEIELMPSFSPLNMV